MEPSNDMKYEGLTRLEHLTYLMRDRIDPLSMDTETLQYLHECLDFIQTVREIWY